ncbi:S-protein homolog 29-like [Mercurialis annua]|uniref:S-protein homolog 29-like n=1 Tax=Mercurialis annua TaxID=3986 RepID=UPI00215EE5E3|nr:S-protein homolog 29-like [Mercurialis annua]
MKSFKREYVVLLMFVLLVSSSDSLFGPDRVTVRIYTGAKSKVHLLNLHCRSGDNDFGNKALKPKEFFEFSFKPNVFGRTAFYCDFQFDNFHISKVDVYGGKRDLHCTACYWQFQEKGLCFNHKPSGGNFTDCRVEWNVHSQHFNGTS